MPPHRVAHQRHASSHLELRPERRKAPLPLLADRNVFRMPLLTVDPSPNAYAKAPMEERHSDRRLHQRFWRKHMPVTLGHRANCNVPEPQGRARHIAARSLFQCEMAFFALQTKDPRASAQTHLPNYFAPLPNEAHLRAAANHGVWRGAQNRAQCAGEQPNWTRTASMR